MKKSSVHPSYSDLDSFDYNWGHYKRKKRKLNNENISHLNNNNSNSNISAKNLSLSRLIHF